MNIFQYKKQLTAVMIIRAVIGTINNLCVLYALRFISVGKSTLVRSINPLCCSIIAAIILREQLEKSKILSTIFAIGGIYLLTLNRENSRNTKEYDFSLLGYFLAFCSAWLFGGIFV